MKTNVKMPAVPFSNEKFWDEWYNNGTRSILDNIDEEALHQLDQMLFVYGLELLVYDAGRSDYVVEITRIGSGAGIKE